MRDGYGLRLRSVDTGESFALDVSIAPMDADSDPAQALAEGYRVTLEPGGLDDDPVKFSTGTYHGEALSLTAMPAALAVSFNDGGQVYTCTAYPTEVTP